MNRRSFLRNLFGAIALAMAPFGPELPVVDVTPLGFYTSMTEGVVIMNAKALAKVVIGG